MTEGDAFDGAAVLVTGGQGFIGSWLVERLLERRARPIVPYRDAPAASRFRVEGLGDRCDVVQADVLDYEALVRVVNEHSVSTVFHLAVQTIVGTANRSPLSTLESNVRGTYNVLEACRTVGAVGDPVERIVVASSDKAYGAHDDLPYREGQSLNAVYPYDVSKACADMIARSYAATYELPVAVTRFANVYGGGDLNLSRIVPDTMSRLIKGERPLIRSDGSPQRDYLYAADAADAYLAVAASLDRPEMRGRAWNAGTGDPVSVLDLVGRIVAVSGRDVEPEVAGSGVPSGEIDRQYLSSDAIRDELGWAPRWELDRGLAETYEWYSRHLDQKAN